MGRGAKLSEPRGSGSPLIRYRTGDLVERALPGSCGCGREETILPEGLSAGATTWSWFAASTFILALSTRSSGVLVG